MTALWEPSHAAQVGSELLGMSEQWLFTVPSFQFWQPRVSAFRGDLPSASPRTLWKDPEESTLLSVSLILPSSLPLLSPLPDSSILWCQKH